MIGGYVMPSARMVVGAWPEGAARDSAASLSGARLKLREALAALAWERHWIVGEVPLAWMRELVERRLGSPLTVKGKLIAIAVTPGRGPSVDRMPWLLLPDGCLKALDVAQARALAREVRRVRHPYVMSVLGVMLLVEHKNALAWIAL